MTHNIVINDENGIEPLPSCRSHREWLVEKYKLEAAIALKFFSDELPIEPAIEHIRECTMCREWLNRIVPANILRRQSRLARYCVQVCLSLLKKQGQMARIRLPSSYFVVKTHVGRLAGFAVSSLIVRGVARNFQTAPLFQSSRTKFKPQ